MKNINNAWARILLVVIPLVIAAFIGWGALKSDVKYNTMELEKKASKETVTVQYEAILRELKQLRVDITNLHRP